MLKNFILIFLLCLFFNLDAMQIPSLRTICLGIIDQHFYQNFNLDESLLEQAEKIKNSLESLPDSLQEKAIDCIDFMLCPQWQEVTRSLRSRYHLNSLTKYEMVFLGCNPYGFFMHDSNNEITYQKNNRDRNDSIKNIVQMPNAPLLLGFSAHAISFFSSDVPFRFLGIKPLEGEKHYAISTDANPVLYVATPHKILTLSCNGITDQTSLESQGFGELSFFHDEVKGPDNPILSLALTHDNQFLYVGCKKKPSYKICLASEMVEELPQKKVDHIIIADDDSIVTITKNYKKKTKIMTKKTVSVEGIPICIKNNIVITSNSYGDLLGYDIHGNLLKRITIRKALGDDSCYFVADQNNFPSLIHVDKGYRDQQVDIFCVPEKLTIDSVYKLAFKMAIEKASDASRKDILEHLYNAEATLDLFPQPSILRNRIREKLNEQEPLPTARCITS